jgi:hypothetical protein
MVFPLSISSVDNVGVWGSSTYDWKRTTDDNTELYSVSHDNRDKHGILVYTDINSSNYNKWFDGSSQGYPQTVVEETINGVVHVALYVGADLYFRFVKPTVASWITPPNPPNTNSYSDAFVSYLVDDNELRVYIPLDKPSTVDPSPDPPGRGLYYQLRKISGPGPNFWPRIVHIQGTPTNETFVPTTAGIYQLEKVQSNPTSYTTYDTAEVSQAQLDFYAANNPPDDDPPDDDPPENDPPPTPVFVPRSARRGNLNFW